MIDISNILKKTNQAYLIPINLGVDIPTGSVCDGMHGETYVNGGINKITGVVGPGNSFKSTIAEDFMLTAASRLFEAAYDTLVIEYDSEMNKSHDRCMMLASKHKHIPSDIFGSGFWSIVNKSDVDADQWLTAMVKIASSEERKKSLLSLEMIKDMYASDPKKTLKILTPIFGIIDSWSEIEPGSSVDALDDGIEGTDTYYLRNGNYKSKLLSKLTSLIGESNVYFFLTAHIASKIDMATGPAKYQQPTRQLAHMKQGDQLKNVSSKFTFLTHNLYFADTATNCINQTTKGQEYPGSYGSQLPEDLKIVRLKLLRSKTGPSGIIIELCISQQDGVLSDLTNFHNIKENNRFGISGTLVNYHLDLYPDVNISRTTVRDKLKENKKLAQACQLTYDLLQAKQHQSGYLNTYDLNCTPIELYEDIKKLGYDWDILLDSRNYTLPNQYTSSTNFLSIFDLLRIRKGLYHPYWLGEDKKTIIKIK